MKKDIPTQTMVQPFDNGVRLCIKSWFRPIYGSRGGYKGQDYSGIISSIRLSVFENERDWENPWLIKNIESDDDQEEAIETVQGVCKALGLSDDDTALLWMRINAQRKLLDTLAEMSGLKSQETA